MKTIPTIITLLFLSIPNYSKACCSSEQEELTVNPHESIFKQYPLLLKFSKYLNNYRNFNTNNDEKEVNKKLHYLRLCSHTREKAAKILKKLKKTPNYQFPHQDRQNIRRAVEIILSDPLQFEPKYTTDLDLYESIKYLNRSPEEKDNKETTTDDIKIAIAGEEKDTLLDTIKEVSLAIEMLSSTLSEEEKNLATQPRTKRFIKKLRKDKRPKLIKHLSDLEELLKEKHKLGNSILEQFYSNHEEELSEDQTPHDYYMYNKFIFYALMEVCLTNARMKYLEKYCNENAF